MIELKKDFEVGRSARALGSEKESDSKGRQ